MEYAPSPRLFHAGPAYDEYAGRRTGFRDTERFYGPPPEEVVYPRPHEGGHSRQYSSHLRQVRYAEDDGQRPEYPYPAEARPREASGPRGKSAADRFLEEFVPQQPPTGEEQAPPQRTDSKPSVSAHEGDEGSRYTPPPLNALPPNENEGQRRPLAAPQAPPSTDSNGSGYQAPAPNGRHVPTPDSLGPPRRQAPLRRRDRLHEQRMPSRYYRYMSVAAREDPYGRAPSITRSQRSRYEEQRRRIDEAETPQPTTERDRAYEPAYSRDHSIDHVSPEETFYPNSRPPPRGYVSVQDRAHHFSPRAIIVMMSLAGPHPQCTTTNTASQSTRLFAFAAIITSHAPIWENTASPAQHVTSRTTTLTCTSARLLSGSTVARRSTFTTKTERGEADATAPCA